jgi:hypothetical protein
MRCGDGDARLPQRDERTLSVHMAQEAHPVGANRDCQAALTNCGTMLFRQEAVAQNLHQLGLAARTPLTSAKSFSK